MGTTNYFDTFIHVADDCPVQTSEVPAPTAKGPTIASLQYQLISAHPYEFTSDDILFTVYATRNNIPDEQRASARENFFAKSQACLRASPLGKKSGWGQHHDSEGRVALVAQGSNRYAELATDAALAQTKAMRSKRAANP